MKKTLFFALPALALVLFAESASARTHFVSIVGFKFVPAKLAIEAGDSVVFRNTSSGTHTVTADPKLVANPVNVALPAGAKAFHSGRLAPGAEFTHDFTVAGTYQYLCLPHERMGMFGTIVVKAPTDEEETF